MGHLANLILALLAAALVDETGAVGAPSPWFVPFVVVAPYALVPVIRRAVRRREVGVADRAVKFLRRAPVLVQFVADWSLGWGVAVATWRGPDELPPGWPTAWDFVRFAPFVLGTAVALDATARVHVDRDKGRRWLRFQARTFVGTTIPIVVFLVVDSLIATEVDVAWAIHGVELWSALHAFVLFAFLIVALPALLQLAWGAEALPVGPLRDLVQRVMIVARFRCREVLLWRTGRSMANAMIVGLLPGTRRVFFSDSLLDALSPRELAAVTAHEIGHAKRGHIAWFLLLAMGAFGSLGALASAWDPAWLVPFELGVVLVLTGGGLAFGWLSRRFELEADLYSVELTGDPLAISSALLRLGGKLRDVAGWRHFAPSARDAFLQRASEDPAFLRAFRRRMTLARAVIVAVFVLGFGGSLVAKVRSFDADRYRVAVWMGRYADARALLDRVDAPESERAAVHRAAYVMENALGSTRPERAADARDAATEWATELGAADDADWLGAVTLLDLAWTVGDEQAAEWFALAVDAANGDDEALRALPEAWRPAVDLMAAVHEAEPLP